MSLLTIEICSPQGIETLEEGMGNTSIQISKMEQLKQSKISTCGRKYPISKAMELAQTNKEQSY
jgi:hypothetical protein